MGWLRRWIGKAVNSLSGDADSHATEWAIATLSALGWSMAVAIIVFGLLHGLSHGLAAGAGFVFWGLATAFVAFLVGGAAGMLFGLPTTRQVVSSNPSASGVPTDGATGYIESTSLEQIADFLVKGLVALSLTTFSVWVGQFDILAGNITATIMGSSITCQTVTANGKAAMACIPPDRAPGGLLLAGFALLGFLIAYLAMRRWFIAEMVKARNMEQRLLAERKRLETEAVKAARADDRQGIGTSSAANPEGSQMVAEKVAEQGVKLAGASPSPSAKAAATEIKKGVAAPIDNDDPWKGVFDGSPARNGFTLSANVSSMVSDPDNFQVDLQVVVDEAKRADALGKSATYYLHPSFGSKPYEVVIGSDGKAPLQIFSYGGFTVGVLMYDGTLLELDLAELPGIPQKFKDR